jgi:hypothetical protein
MNPPQPSLSSSATPAFPPGTNNVYWFAVFNALSFHLILSSPMVLYAKTLGASATVLGIIAGMMPLLVIFQIPAAKHLSRTTYKRFVMAGWAIRVMFIFAISLVPLTSGFLDATTRLSLLLMLLFGFNLARGISSCAWLPWITSLIPAPIRGRYLLRDAGWQNVAGFAVFLLAAVCLGTRPEPWQFAALFAFSATMGTISLQFLKRIPEPVTPEQTRVSRTAVPWLEIAAYPPFRKLLWFNIGWPVAFGGLPPFIVAFLKAETTLSSGEIMFVSSIAFIGGLSSLWFLGPRLDRLGSKPVMLFALLVWIGIMGGWIVMAADWVSPCLLLVGGLQFLMGLVSALLHMANTRLAMAVIPQMGRNHFFALYSVIGSLTLGLSPIVWGLILDGMAAVQVEWNGFELNRFSIYFMAVAGAFVMNIVLCRRLEEPEAASLEELLRDILQQSPLRIWLRFWPRS